MNRTVVLAVVIFAAIMAMVGLENRAASSPRQRCKDAVVAEYEQADKVLQQPTDLDGFCAAWNNHPPGITP